MAGLLRTRIIIVESFVVELHPEILLSVNIQFLHALVETEILFQFPRGVTLELLRLRVVDTVVHALMQPQFAVQALHNLTGMIVAHGGGIAHVRKERFYAVAVIPVQSVGRSKPHIPSGVAVATVHLRVRQSVASVQPAELHVGQGSLYGHRQHQQEGQHQERLLQQRLGRGLADHQFLGHLLLIHLRVAFDMLQQQLARLDTHLVRLVLDGRQPWGDIRRMHVVRKADQCHVLRNHQPTVLDGRKRRKGNDVVECHDGIRTVVAFQQLHGVPQRHLIVYLVANHQIAVYRYLVVAQRLQIAVLAAAHHVQVVRSADECNAPAARLYQVLRGLVRSLVAIGRDTRETLRQTRTAEEHQRGTHLGNLLEVAVVLRVLGQTGYDALHMQSQEVVHRHRLVLEILVAVGTDHAVARTACLTLNTVQHCRIIVRHQVRHHHANHLRGLLAQTLGKGIGAIV